MAKRSGDQTKNSSWSPNQAPPIIGHSEPMRHLRSLIEVISDYNCTVLVNGETGTGKELVARHLHARSDRSAGPFVTVDCTTLGDSLFESQLFGHTKGAFTGAESDTIGFFRAADGGTLFLDEIGELGLPVQAKLLRCIQDSAVIPLGSVQPIRANVRILAATHRNLKGMVQKAQFREDLFFRLNVIALKVPPLRDRKGDYPELARHILGQLAELYDKPVKELSPEAMAVLETYPWPGNVREFANAMEHAFILSPTRLIMPAHLPDGIRPCTALSPPDTDGSIVPLEEAERNLIRRALSQTQGNISLAAQMLGIERHRLSRKIRRYALDGPLAQNVPTIPKYTSNP